MGKKSNLSPECQKCVNKLFVFFIKEKATKKPIVSFDMVYQRTSKALVSSIQHYMIKFVSELRQVGGFFPGTPVSSTNETDRHDI